MRQYIFRGKDITTGEWRYGSLVNNLWTYSENHSLHGQQVCEIISTGECDDYSDMEDKDLNRTVIPESVGQSTGLKDKNGKEAWEGDIVIIVTTGLTWGKEYEWTGVVEYSRSAFVVKSKNGKKEHYTSFHPDRPFEIIGNIHDNPELLTDAK